MSKFEKNLNANHAEVLFSIDVQELKCDFCISKEGLLTVEISERNTTVLWENLLRFYKDKLALNEVVGYYYQKTKDDITLTKLLVCTKTDRLINIGCLEFTKNEFEKIIKLIKYKYDKTKIHQFERNSSNFS